MIKIKRVHYDFDMAPVKSQTSMTYPSQWQQHQYDLTIIILQYISTAIIVNLF